VLVPDSQPSVAVSAQASPAPEVDSTVIVLDDDIEMHNEPLVKQDERVVTPVQQRDSPRPKRSVASHQPNQRVPFRQENSSPASDIPGNHVIDLESEPAPPSERVRMQRRRALQSDPDSLTISCLSARKKTFKKAATASRCIIKLVEC
jgi:hypothetical protein